MVVVDYPSNGPSNIPIRAFLRFSEIRGMKKVSLHKLHVNSSDEVNQDAETNIRLKSWEGFTPQPTFPATVIKNVCSFCVRIMVRHALNLFFHKHSFLTLTLLSSAV